ncbi:MAG: Fe-S cluster assembly ATPase SufC [Gemmatimonadetes bacterium]|nr:Fe-S cluster assembly ATPase SufC [Gemmatimonadota bacterium]MDA1102044.1 Fe-S cluster assembly ATPase SufC [Gemmatimonadota bacterium]
MSDVPVLRIEGLEAKVAESELGILNGLDLQIGKGEIHAIMGPNGSGKSTLAKVLAGHPGYEVTSGTVTFRGEDLLTLEADERSLAGVFLAFQYPVEIAGVSIANFLRTAVQAHLPEGEELDIFDFSDILTERMAMLDMDVTFAERHVNDGFSGGEKKRNEILQMAMLKPKLAVMDETDSGLDIDALKIVADGVNKLLAEDPDMSVLLITHYQRLLDYIKPHHVHVMVDGRIVESGGPEVALELEANGYRTYETIEPSANGSAPVA